MRGRSIARRVHHQQVQSDGARCLGCTLKGQRRFERQDGPPENSIPARHRHDEATARRASRALCIQLPGGGRSCGGGDPLYPSPPAPPAVFRPVSLPSRPLAPASVALMCTRNAAIGV
eukprot:5092907-Pyramimonas_sp.AAC.1